MVLILVVIIACATFAEAWTLMLIAGWAHIHLLEAIHPISYGVSLQAILCTLPAQAIVVALGALGDA